MTDELRQSIAELWTRHRGAARRSLTLVRDALDRLEAGNLDEGTRVEARAEAHRLAGALGVFGYRDGSVLNARAEQLLGGTPDDDAKGLRAALAELDRDLAAEAAT